MGRKKQTKFNNELFSAIIDILHKKKVEKDELVRPILPVREWVKDQYYVGSDGICLFDFWINTMCDVFEGERVINVVTLSGGIGCRPVGSFYNTTSGYKRLSEIKVGDNILSPNGIATVIGNHNVGVKDTMVVTFSNGERVEATEDHRVRCLTEEGIEWVQFQHLREDSRVLYSCLASGYDGDDEESFEGFRHISFYNLGYQIPIIFYTHHFHGASYLRRDEEYETAKRALDAVFKKSLRIKSLFLSGVFDVCAETESGELVLALSNTFLASRISNLLRELGIIFRIENDCGSLLIEHESIPEIRRILSLQNDRLKGDLERLALEKEEENRGLVDLERYPEHVREYVERNRCRVVYPVKISCSRCECGDIEVEGHEYINQGFIQHNTGKSTCGLFMMVRMLYELSCHKSIHKYLKLNMESAMIVFLYFSLSKFVAKRTGFKQFREIVDSIPYFRDNFPTDPKSKDEVRFPSNVYFLYGTSTGDAIGSNMLCSLLDEANFFSNSSGESTDFNKVAELHRALIARQASRFMKMGENKSLSIVVSSATFKSSYTEELRKRSLTDPTVKFYRARKWDIEPEGSYSTTEFFYVYCGDDKVDPFIIEEVSDISSRLGLDITASTVKDAVNKMPIEQRSLVDEIPIDFKKQYEYNIVKSLQDFSGYSTESTNMLFGNRTVFNSCIDNGIPDLFFKNEFTIETGNTDPSNNISYYMRENSFINPMSPRYIHVDLGLTNDACGIACCHKGESVDVDGVKHDVYIFDFSLRIVPPEPPKKISITRVEEFIIYLRDKLRLTIGMVSYDNFQSAGSLQRLGDLGFNVRLQSVDRDDKAYLYFVENLYLRTVKFNSTFASSIDHELFNLIHYREKHKVDHPSDTAHGGMKDRMDSVVGAVYNAFEDKTVKVNFEDTMNLSMYNSMTLPQDNYLSGMNGYDY